jgi:hypothetical protein
LVPDTHPHEKLNYSPLLKENEDEAEQSFHDMKSVELSEDDQKEAEKHTHHLSWF